MSSRRERLEQIAQDAAQDAADRHGHYPPPEPGAVATKVRQEIARAGLGAAAYRIEVTATGAGVFRVEIVDTCHPAGLRVAMHGVPGVRLEEIQP